MKKIATLIPAYKTEYMGELLVCLNHQTYKDFKVTLSDDSPNGSVSALLASDAFRPLMANLDINIIQGTTQRRKSELEVSCGCGGDRRSAAYPLR